MQSNYFTGIYTMQPHAGHAQIATLSTINSHAVLSIPNVSAITDLNLHTNTQSSNNTSTNSGNSINIHSSAAVQNHNHHTHHNHQQHSQTNDDSFDNVSSHACGVCGSTFRKSSGLKKHMKNHVIEQGRTLKVNNEAAEHPYKCNACKIQYPNSMSFEHHMEKEHAQPQALKCTQCGCFRPILLTSSSPFRCETCTHRNGDVFESSGLIKYQITSHIANPVSAQQIHVAHSKNLKLRLTDTNHTRRSRKQHQCPICEKSYKHQSTLAMHKKQHTGEYKYKCEYCYKEFYLTEYYTRHMRVHTREKPYTCDTCDKSFSQSNTLTQHKRIHTGRYSFYELFFMY